MYHIVLLTFPIGKCLSKFSSFRRPHLSGEVKRLYLCMY